MTRACLGLLAGMYALQLSSFTDTSDYMTAALVAACLLLMARQLRLFIWFSLGVLLFAVAARQVIDSRLAPDFAGDSIVVDVNVVGFSSRENANVTFIASPVDNEKLPGRIRLSWFEAPVEIHSGDSWQFEVRLRRPRGNRNAGGFDFESWLFRERIGAVGYVVDGRRNHLLRSNPGSLTQRIRRRFVNRVEKLVDEPELASVLVALVVGSRHLITAEQWDRYAATGSSHLMAISGLHIGLAAGGAYFVALFAVGVLGRRGNHQRAAILFSLLVAVSYALVSGFAVPARRASLMLVMTGAALLRMRRPDMLAIVSTACFAVAVTDPLSTMRPGFVLSFVAVLALIWTAQRRRAGIVTLQMNLLFGLLPLTVVLFDRISFAALPVNLVAVPLFSFVTVPLSLAGLLLDGPAEVLGDGAIQLAAQSVSWLEKLLRVVAATDWAAYTTPDIVGIHRFVILVPALWLALPGGWPGRYLAWLGVAAILLYAPPRPEPACAVVNVLDVGQGLAVVVRTSGHVVLYDSGPSFRTGTSAADTVILPFLRSVGIRQIDTLVISHADLDHAGGVHAIRAAMPVHRMLAGEGIDRTPSIPCLAGQNWNYDGIEFSVLHPPPGFDAEGNNLSCVILLRAGAYRVLLTGDIEQAVERRLVSTRRLPRVDAVIVPHHGSRTSSTRSFIRALTPSFAIVSAGFGNQWGFPKDDVVGRWEAAGATVLTTATSGGIELRVCAASGLASINEYRLARRRIWHE